MVAVGANLAICREPLRVHHVPTRSIVEELITVYGKGTGLA
jgi:hypothetical protein